METVRSFIQYLYTIFREIDAEKISPFTNLVSDNCRLVLVKADFAVNPRSSSLPIDIHGDGEGAGKQCDASDNTEHIEYTSRGEPVVDNKCDDEREAVFEEDNSA